MEHKIEVKNIKLSLLLNIKTYPHFTELPLNHVEFRTNRRHVGKRIFFISQPYLDSFQLGLELHSELVNLLELAFAFAPIVLQGFPLVSYLSELLVNIDLVFLACMGDQRWARLAQDVDDFFVAVQVFPQGLNVERLGK